MPEPTIKRRLAKTRDRELADDDGLISRAVHISRCRIEDRSPEARTRPAPRDHVRGGTRSTLQLKLVLLLRSVPNDDKLRELLNQVGLIERFTPYVVGGRGPSIFYSPLLYGKR